MRAIRCTPLVLLFAAIAAAPGHAANPFTALDSIRLSLEIGSPLNLEGTTAPELLTDDLRRFNVFERNLRTALVSRIEACGLLVDRGAREYIAVDVFGHPKRRKEAGPLYVFLVETRAVDENGRVMAPPGRVLGLASDAEVEQEVIAAALAALPDAFQKCEGS